MHLQLYFQIYVVMWYIPYIYIYVETEDYIWSVFGNIHSWTHALSLGVSSLLPWHTLPWAGLWPLVVRYVEDSNCNISDLSTPDPANTLCTLTSLHFGLRSFLFPVLPNCLTLFQGPEHVSLQGISHHTLQKGAGDPELQRHSWAAAQTPFLWNPLALTAGKLGSNHVFPWLGRKSHSLQKYQFWDHSENSD